MRATAKVNSYTPGDLQSQEHAAMAAGTSQAIPAGRWLVAFTGNQIFELQGLVYGGGSAATVETDDAEIIECQVTKLVGHFPFLGDAASFLIKNTAGDARNLRYYYYEFELS